VIALLLIGLAMPSFAEPEPEDSVDEGDQDPAELEKKQAWKDKRKHHYNEMAQVKKMMAARIEDDDEDEDDSDENADTQDSDCSPGQWGKSPDDLHGGAKLPNGQRVRAIPTDDADAFMPADCDTSASSSSAPAPAVLRHICTSSVRGVLRKDGPRPQSDKRLVWDEETIAEHDLERGTRQKIDEPNTPWMGSPQMSNEGSPNLGGTPVEGEPGQAPAPPEIGDLNQRLDSWYREEMHRPSIQSRWGSDCANRQDDDATSTEKGDAFAAKRKQHYNEVDKVRKALAQASVAEDEDDDVDENADSKKDEDEEQKPIEDEEDEKRKKAEFAAKRKQHYNEMDLIRKMKAAQLAEEDDEDEDSDEG